MARCPICNDYRFIQVYDHALHPSDEERKRYGNIFCDLDAFEINRAELVVVQRNPSGYSLCHCPICQSSSSIGQAATQRYYAMLRSVDATRSSPVNATSLRFNGTDLEHFPGQIEAVDAIRHILKREHGMLTLFGGYGTGKTTLMQVACGHMHDKGIAAVYTTGNELAVRLREAATSDDSNEQQRVINALCVVPMLVIDEIEKDIRTSFQRSSIFAIIDQRYRDSGSKITIFGCNALPDDPAIVSRMNEFPVIKMDTDVRPTIKRIRERKGL